jgi:4-hydroxy-tetrahydrodipicolinate synthase
MFKGIYTALVTPFKNDVLDLALLDKLIDRQLEAGINNFVLCSSTGEGELLSAKEKELILDSVVKRISDKGSVIINCSESDTSKTLNNIKQAADKGAYAVVVDPPGPFSVNQDGFFSHFSKIADNSPLSVIISNNCRGMQTKILPATIARLARHGNIAAVADYSVTVKETALIAASSASEVTILCSNDFGALASLITGAKGVISTSANLVPQKWALLWKNWTQKKIMEASAVQNSLTGLHEALSHGQPPETVKAGLQLFGLCNQQIRLPFTWPHRPVIYRLAAELESSGFKIQTGALQ